MGKLPGITHQQAVRVFGKVGFHIERQSGHIIMSDGERTLIIPRANPINPFTMYQIAKAAGLTADQFRGLL